MSDTSYVPIPNLDDAERDRVLRECASADCTNAKNVLVAARNDIVDKCGDWKYLDSQAWKFLAAAIAVAALAAAMAGSAVLMAGVPELIGSKAVAGLLLNAAFVLAAIAVVMFGLFIGPKFLATRAKKSLRNLGTPSIRPSAMCRTLAPNNAERTS